jgi:hypothetical protein
MGPPVYISRHALERWRERVGPLDRDSLIQTVQFAVRAKGLRMPRRGGGFLIRTGRTCIIVQPEALGWRVVTVWRERPLRR